jgi:hypothetical protein
MPKLQFNMYNSGLQHTLQCIVFSFLYNKTIHGFWDECLFLAVAEYREWNCAYFQNTEKETKKVFAKHGE